MLIKREGISSLLGKRNSFLEFKKISNDTDTYEPCVPFESQLYMCTYKHL